MSVETRCAIALVALQPLPPRGSPVIPLCNLAPPPARPAPRRPLMDLAVHRNPPHLLSTFKLRISSLFGPPVRPTSAPFPPLPALAPAALRLPLLRTVTGKHLTTDRSGFPAPSTPHTPTAPGTLHSAPSLVSPSALSFFRAPQSTLCSAACMNVLRVPFAALALVVGGLLHPTRGSALPHLRRDVRHALCPGSSISCPGPAPTPCTPDATAQPGGHCTLSRICIFCSALLSLPLNVLPPTLFCRLPPPPAACSRRLSMPPTLFCRLPPPPAACSRRLSMRPCLSYNTTELITKFQSPNASAKLQAAGQT
ncbi:hypothetical protein DFH06DRAFT_1328895 [Mycena polygramma]|nr:hypothetical protein DFH06DRAFT_1328895 [Mycena polygramma]